jgi:NADH-quinone oxidoreductase subunit L
MGHVALLIPLFPLLGFGIVLISGTQLRGRTAGWIATGAVAASFICAVVAFVLLLHDSNREVTVTLYNWIDTGSLHVSAGLLVDPLSITMCLFVTGISALIHMYSVSYMDGEADYRKFFIYLNLFVFSMLILVLANSLLLTFVGWEGVGVCSYWLVGYYFDRDSAATAGKKAFLYNRVGDAGFLLATFLLFRATGSLNYLTIFGQASRLSGAITTAVVILLLLAATGKSAQLPLFNWLPDAMEGPTPVSALIHAATMVTAGVYLLVRMSPVLYFTHDGRLTIAIVGGVTAFVAATIATSQSDIKRVLAFSTISQIGYMVLAVGTGAYAAAIFLMVAHAFYKALLFLGSGSVIHSLSGEQDLHKMGALRRFLPYTFPAFLVGWLAIIGIPPFAGFWAKGDVLTSVYGTDKWLWALGLVTAVLTAYYMTRLFVLTFLGTERFREVTHDHDPHESPWIMVTPLIVLSVLATFGGVIDLPWVHGHSLTGFLAGSVFAAPGAVAASSTLQWALVGVDVAAAVIGLLGAWAIWRTTSPWPRAESEFLARWWRLDDLYDAAIGRPSQRVGAVAADVIEPLVIDGAVTGAATLVRRSAEGLRPAQSGFLRHYALATAAGLSALVVFFLVRSW